MHVPWLLVSPHTVVDCLSVSQRGLLLRSILCCMLMWRQQVARRSFRSRCCGLDSLSCGCVSQRPFLLFSLDQQADCHQKSKQDVTRQPTIDLLNHRSDFDVTRSRQGLLGHLFRSLWHATINPFEPYRLSTEGWSWMETAQQSVLWVPFILFYVRVIADVVVSFRRLANWNLAFCSGSHWL